jgi:hypothetical protein
MLNPDCRIHEAEINFLYQLLLLLTSIYPNAKTQLANVRKPNICVVIQSFSEIKGHINPDASSDSESDSDDEPEPPVKFETVKKAFYKLLTQRVNRDIYQKGCQYDFS